MSTPIEERAVKSVEIEHVEKHYAGYHALHDINLALDSGEFTVMVGPSGCGKSTLLKTIAGLESVSAGRLRINGRDVTREEPGERGIAMVFQSYALYPHMTVAENMGFGLRMAKRPKAEIEADVGRAAKILRITEQLGKLPRQLSGGQRQRVAIGRAITRSPDVFLFDEPLSNLDAALRTQMRVELSTLHAELGSTMIYVTHDQVEAMTMASRIVVLNGGRIEQVGAPLELYANPANHFVASFLGAPRMNFVEGRVEAADASGAKVAVPGLPSLAFDGLVAAPRPGEAVRVGLRPEHLRLPAAGESLDVQFEGTLRLCEDLGRESIFYVDAAPVVATGSDTGTANLSVHTTRALAPAPGSRVSLGCNLRDAYLFAADGRTLSAQKSICHR